MQRITKFFPILFSLILITGKAQLNGVYTVPGTIANLAAAINSLNTLGVSGAVTINIAAGYTETTPFGGYQLNQINGSSATNTIKFKKSGSGNNPVISAYFGGTGTPSSGTNQDGIWRFVGTDYVTVDGIDLVDPNNVNPATMEFGYGFFKANGNDGCLYNTIQNCTVTLNRINAVAGMGSSPGGSKGIYMIAAAPGALTLAIGGNVIQASNSYNKFYGNKIQNCQQGISIIGYEGQGFVPYCDQFNDVGGIVAATGNTVVNFGGSPGNSESVGIEASYQYSFNVSYNKVNNNDGAGFDPANFLTAIRTSYYTSADLTINSNSINLSSSPASTLTMNGITNLTSYSISLNPPAMIYINNNVFSSYSGGMSATITPLARALIYSTGYTSHTRINNNLMQNISTGILTNLIHCNRAYTCTINSNTISNVSYENNFSAITSNAYSLTVIGNSISALSTTNAPSYPGFRAIGGGDFSNIFTINSNTITNISGDVFCGICFNSNTIINPQFSVTTNEISNINSVPGTTASVGFTGIYVNDNSTSSSSAFIRGNNIHSFSSTGAVSYTNFGNTSSFTGIYLNSIDYPWINQNKIHSFSSDRFGSYLNGLVYSGSSSFCNCYTDISNNLVGNFEITNTNGSINGFVLNERNHNVSFNTVNFSSLNTGSNTISSAILFSAPQSFNPRTITVMNNILVNELPSTGNGLAQVLNINAPVSYFNNASNRNIYYVGATGPNRVIANMNGTWYTSITAFKSAVSPRESLTFTESPVFSSTVGLSPDYLNLNPTVTTLAENGAIPVNGILDDYSGATRNVNNPDIGAWEGNYAGFDRVAPLILGYGFTTLPCGNFTTRTFTLALMDTSGIAGSGASPRVYYKVNSGSYISVQGVLSSGTSTNGVWTFNLTYSGFAGATISYYFVAQDQSSFNNLFISPSLGAAASSVNSIQTPPSSPYTYLLQNYPTISVNSGSICPGQIFYMNVSGGVSTYTFSSGASTVAPLVSTSYSVTGTSISGCLSTNTAVANVTVYNSPTVTVNSGAICLGETFNIIPAGATTYSVQGGNWGVSPAVTTNYTVAGKSNQGCISNVAIATITVNPLPVITLSTSSSVMCVGETATLSAGGAITYTFIPGGVVTNVVISPGATSNFTVAGTDDKGCINIAVITQSVDACTGLTQLRTEHTQARVYPNPTKDILNLESEAAYQLIILNAVGELVYSSEINSGAYQIDLGNLSNGIYLARLLNPSNSKTFKIIKE